MQWATPTIQRAHCEAQYKVMLGYFEILDRAIEDVIKIGTNSTREIFMNIGSGELYFVGYTEWIISYEGFAESINISYISYNLESPLGLYRIVAENAGMVSESLGESRIFNKPLVLENKNPTDPRNTSLLFALVNFTLSGVRGGGAGSYRFWIKLNSITATEELKVSNFTLKIDSKLRKNTWYDYFCEGYKIANVTGNAASYLGFAPDPANERIIYKTVLSENYLEEENELNLRIARYDLEITIEVA
jgi:hypothetical protein